MKTPFILGLIFLGVLFFVARLLATRRKPQTALEVFRSRRTWKDLPADFQEALATSLQSVATARDFVALCEPSGILDNAIVGCANLDVSYALASVAAKLTSYANAMGGQGKFQEAKRALEHAMLLRPRYAPAWASMALVSVSLQNCGSAIAWADKVLNFKPDPDSDDPWEVGAARAVTPEGERWAADAFAEPELVGRYAEVRKQMIAIKDFCREKP